MNIIDTIKAKAFQAMNRCEEYMDSNKEWSMVQWGRAIGLMQALDEICGQYANLESLKARKADLEEKLFG